MKILQLLKKALLKEEQETEANHSESRRADWDLVHKYTADPDFPYLVSFSRTGSHWLRMTMELYFGKPSLTLLFFTTTSEAKGYTCFHTHDLDLEIKANRVIYLYRDPVDTIYSQMTYHEQNIDDVALVDGWADLYARHLHKWLVEENFTTKKVVLTYENMKKDMAGEFAKLCDFFGQKFDPVKLAAAMSDVSKEKIKEKTQHDPKVINTSSDYESLRKEFRKKYADRIYAYTFEMFPDLRSFLN